MKLQDELHTRGFESDGHEALLNVLFTASWLRCAGQRRFKPYGLTPEQYNVLRILRGSHPRAMLVKDITCRMIDRSSNTTRIIDKLAARGLVARSANPDNRREVLVRLEDAGQQLLATISAEVPTPAALSLSQAEARQLNMLLDKLRDSDF
ncbi:MAG: MarR family transcriptional regulator [Bacteroidia bacterium]